MSIKENQQRLAQAITDYVQDEQTINQLTNTLNDLKFETEFKKIDLFGNILNELNHSLKELSRKELKQRILLIQSFDYQL
ncbi:MAG: hypothetical protein HRU03_04460 [Nanoarchaeales archaeon]|nr:hypothetical protein [Nanoarchaeales archaeon]